MPHPLIQIIHEIQSDAMHLLPQVYVDVAPQVFQEQQNLFPLVQSRTKEAVSFLATSVSDIAEPRDYMRDLGQLYVGWRKHDDMQGMADYDVTEQPSLVALMIEMAEYFKIDLNGCYGKAMIAAALMGDLPNHNEFHSNAHFRDITATVFRLLTAYEQFQNEDNFPVLDDRYKALALIAAAVHDFAHDGKGNALDGVHMPMRLEEQAFELAAPLLQYFGLNEDDLRIVRTMILCTDVSYGKQGMSPSRILNRCYNHFYNGTEAPDIKVADYKPLADALLADKNLCLLAMMLEESDIFTSVGLSYEYAKMTTVLVAQETKVLSSKASTLHGFIEMICEGLIATPAALHLFTDTFAYIYGQASEDVQKDADYARMA